MLTISFGVLVFRSFTVWGWFLHALLFNVPHKTVCRLAYFVYQVLAVSQYKEWHPTPGTAVVEDRPVCGANEKLGKVQ